MDTPVTGAPRTLLRLEDLAVLVASIAAYHTIDGSWLLFALLLLVPDLSLFGYAAGPRIGAFVYNAAHTYLGPGILAACGYLGAIADAWWLCLIWLAHIGLDRSLGLGLKLPHAFAATHLGPVGKAAPTT